MVFALSYAQAAATLAATTVGAEIGLFGQDVVNAVVVVIVVSLFGSSVLASRAAPRIAPAAGAGRSLGSEVVTAIADPDQATRLVPLAARIARTDGGNLVPVHVIADADNDYTIADARANAKGIDEIVRKAGFDADASLRVAASVRQGIRNEIAERDASLLVLGHVGRDPARDLPVRQHERGGRQRLPGPGARGDAGRGADPACGAADPAPRPRRQRARRDAAGDADRRLPRTLRARAGRRHARTARGSRTWRSPTTPSWSPSTAAGPVGERVRGHRATSCCCPAARPASCSTPRRTDRRNRGRVGRGRGRAVPPVGRPVRGRTSGRWSWGAPGAEARGRDAPPR